MGKAREARKRSAAGTAAEEKSSDMNDEAAPSGEYLAVPAGVGPVVHTAR